MSRRAHDIRDFGPARKLTAYALWGAVTPGGWLHQHPYRPSLYWVETGFPNVRGAELCATVWPKRFAWVRLRDLDGFLRARHMRLATLTAGRVTRPVEEL